MKAAIYILLWFCPLIVLHAQGSMNQPALDTIIYPKRACKDGWIADTIIYTRLHCGLYRRNNGDIGFRTEGRYNNSDIRTRYITSIYCDKGLGEMKNIIDTASFRFLSDLYWVDAHHVYGFNYLSDGGTVYLNTVIDRKTFVVLDDAGYAKDTSRVYYRGQIIKDADLHTFKSLPHKEFPELAYDKRYFYETGQRLSDAQVKEYHLDTLRK